MTPFLATLPILLVSAGRAEWGPGLPRDVSFATTPGGVEVRIGGQPFTTYHWTNPDGSPLRRPYLYPVLADDGTPVTSDQFLVPKGDHPHHRSIWVGHGDVNGEDHWGTNDRNSDGPRELPDGAPEIGLYSITQRLNWTCGGNCLLSEDRRILFDGFKRGVRSMLIISRFTASKGITFGDTKEAGLVAVRMSPWISASPVITASSGCNGETGCWGQPAAWCDISGSLGRETFGITVVDHPGNPRYPSRWHVRAYGLLAANPFGLSAFDKSPRGTGDLVLKAGETITFRHLVIIHQGAQVAGALSALVQAFSGSSIYEEQTKVDLGNLNRFWNAPSPNSWWSVTDGVLTGRQDPERKGSVLESRDAYRDVIVDLEYRYSGEVDSGIFLRSGRKWQCQIGISRSLQRDLTGSIYDPDRKYVAEAKAAPALNRQGEWNRLRIEARGDRFRHWLNGVLVLDYTDPAFTGSGPIGLQIHPGLDMKIEFRNIRVLRFESPSPSPR